MNICSEQSVREAPVVEQGARQLKHSKSSSEIVFTLRQREEMERRLSLASQGECS